MVVWENVGLIRVKKSTVEGFTTPTGMKIRKLINPVFRAILKLVIRHKIHVLGFPELEKDTPYIFASSHTYVDDVIINYAYIDRNAYMLIGTTDQLEHNPLMYASWLAGLVYVDRQDKSSRKASVDKMERLLKNGTSVLLYPEGSLNNTENLLCQQLYSGVWQLVQRTGVKVVPIAIYNDYPSDHFYYWADEPIDMHTMEKDAAMDLLRDTLAGMKFEMMEKYGTKLRREELPADKRAWYLEHRKKEYQTTKWTRDCWEEEIAPFYHWKLPPSPIDVLESIKNVELSAENCGVIAPMQLEYENEQRYNIVKYMKDNWDK